LINTIFDLQTETSTECTDYKVTLNGIIDKDYLLVCKLDNSCEEKLLV